MSELPVSLAERVWLAAPLAAVQLDEFRRGRYLAHAERLVQRINWEAARGLRSRIGSSSRSPPTLRCSSPGSSRGPSRSAT
jgi:hypothetical protein